MYYHNIMNFKNIKVIIILILLISNSGFLFSQIAKEVVSISDSTIANIDNKILELDVYIKSAIKNSPLLKLSESQIRQVLEQIKIQKKSWTEFVLFDANAKYGLYNQVSVTDLASTGVEGIGIITNKEQLNYYAGITLRLPLSKFINKKSELKILNENLEQKKSEKNEVENQIREFVIQNYYDLAYLNKSMQINQDMLQALNVNLMKAEKEIQSGRISIEEYNAIIVQKGKIEESFYKLQNEYFVSYKKLELLTGINNEN